MFVLSHTLYHKITICQVIIDILHKMWYNQSMGIKDVVKEYYESNRISFVNLAKNSESIFGQKITVDQLKKWSTADNGWKKPEISSDAKLGVIAEKIFESIEEDDLSAKDLAALANTYLSITTKAPPSATDNNKPTLQEIIDTVKSDDLDAASN
jgi:hypothetical protein